MSYRIFLNLFQHHGLDALTCDSYDDGVFFSFLAGAQEDRVALFGAPEVRAENESVL